MEILSPPKSNFKTKTPKIHLVVFYVVHHILLCVAFLPTLFFVYHLYQPEHKNWLRGSSGQRSTPTVLWRNMDRTLSTTANATTNISLLLNNSQVTSQECNAPLVLNHSANECFVPCNWSTLSPLTQRILYGLMVTGFWVALFATVVIMITWSKIKSLRGFPHVVRFYIISACICLACCKMLPLRIGLTKVFCGAAAVQWESSGRSSMYITVQGACCHYFTLALCFWSTCFIGNTYLVVVRGNRKLFEKPIQIHIIQSLLSWLLPAIIVASCIYAKYPGPAYKMLFIDFMTARLNGELMAYLSVTLPMQLTLGASLCLLWSVTWYIRRSRLDNTRHAIRADRESQTMLRIERQFTSMTVMILIVVGVVLSLTTIMEYKTEKLVFLAQEYLDCLKRSQDCQKPYLLIPLYAIIILAPGFLCLVFFFLLFMNKDCRQIWKAGFQRISRLANVTKPRSDTSKSRCSSTLTILGDRRLSDFGIRSKTTQITRIRTSSTPNLLGVYIDRPTALEMHQRAHLSPNVVGSRPRSSSTPVRFRLEDDHDIQDNLRITSLPRARRGDQTPSHFNIEIRITSTDPDKCTNNQFVTDNDNSDSKQHNTRL